jgi:glutamyl-tRNA(Gln) amidotransferase subunit D
MADNKYKGYRGPALSVLKNFNVYVWSDVEVQTTKGVFAGVILPRSETADDRHLVLKMPNGYNIGVRAENIEVRNNICTPPKRSGKRSKTAWMV